jgi:hypothetical protein
MSDDEVYQFINDCYIFILNKLRIKGFDDSKGTYDSALFRVWYTFVLYRKTTHRVGMKEILFKEYFENLQQVTNNFTVFNDATMEPFFVVKIRDTKTPFRYKKADSLDLILIKKFIQYLKTKYRADPENKGINIYQKAYIYGLEFRSRKIPHANELKYNWSSSDNLMSWAKFIDYKNLDDKDPSTGSVQGRRTLNSTDMFMNINYFFRIDFKEEIHLHEVAFANGTSRRTYKSKAIPDEQWKKPKNGPRLSSTSNSRSRSSSKESSISPPQPCDEENFLEHVLVGAENQSVFSDCIFVPCVYFYASKVMVLPYHDRHFEYPTDVETPASFRHRIENAKPYLLRKHNINIAPEQNNCYADCSSVDINFMTMILMHPAKCLDYLYNDLLLRPNCDKFSSRFLHNKNLDF